MVRLKNTISQSVPASPIMMLYYKLAFRRSLRLSNKVVCWSWLGDKIKLIFLRAQAKLMHCGKGQFCFFCHVSIYDQPPTNLYNLFSQGIFIKLINISFLFIPGCWANNPKPMWVCQYHTSLHQIKLRTKCEIRCQLVHQLFFFMWGWKIGLG